MTVPLYVGVDVGKAKNVVCFMGPDGAVLLKKATFNNSLTGAQQLVAKAKELLVKEGCDHPRANTTLGDPQLVTEKNRPVQYHHLLRSGPVLSVHPQIYHPQWPL